MVRSSPFNGGDEAAQFEGCSPLMLEAPFVEDRPHLFLSSQNIRQALKGAAMYRLRDRKKSTLPMVP
jgi:hypothetical protein